MPIFTPINEASFSTLHEDILASRIKEFEKSVKAEHVSIGLRFFHEEVKTIARDHPSLMHDTAITSRLGFPDVIMPDDQRNHLYIKLWTGDFPSLVASGSKLRAAQSPNVEVEMEVRARDGSPVPGAVSRGSGEPNITRFTSTIFRNSVSPSEYSSLFLRALFTMN
jgi:dedicator of cytokinesis protein 3